MKRNVQPGGPVNLLIDAAHRGQMDRRTFCRVLMAAGFTAATARDLAEHAAEAQANQASVAWGDGWLPNRIAPDQLRESRATLDRLAKEAGRDPSAITISVHGQPADGDLIKRFHDAGATRVIVRPATSKTEAEMVSELTRIAEAVLR